MAVAPSADASWGTVRHPRLGLGGLGGQEGDPGGVAPGRGKVEVDHLTEEGVGDLDQDAGAVAGVDLGARRAPVLHVAQALQAEADHPVAAPTVHVHHEGHAAGVVLQPRLVEPRIVTLGGEIGARPVIVGARRGRGKVRHTRVLREGVEEGSLPGGTPLARAARPF
jgi:hypothetical protein